MTLRTLVVLAAVPFVFASTPRAQSPSGATMPGPAGSRPQPVTPPRDGTPTAAPTGTARIRGRVVAAETGRPLRRAQVRLVGTNATGNGQPPAMRTANTDGDGRYEFTGLPAAGYSLTVSRSGYLTLQFGQQRPFEPGKPLTLADAEVADKIDFALPHGGVIAGKVTDETGEPVPGVRLQAQRYQYMPGGQRRLITATSGPGQFATDDLGQFRVYGLMPGSYVLSAVPAMNGVTMMTMGSGDMMMTGSSGSQDGNEGYATTYFPGTANVDEAQTITVGLGQEGSAFFPLVLARMSRVSGVIRNSQGERLSGRTLISLRTVFASGTGYTTNGMTSIAPDGSFTISNIPPGDHFIDVRPAPVPPRPGAPTQATDGEDEFASVPINVSGQDISGLVITTGPGATIAGRVIFDGTSPVPAQTPQPVRVIASPADPFNSSANIGPMSAMDNGLVDDGGRFQLRGVNGQVLFRVGAQGWNLKSVMLNGVDITDTTLDARPSSTVTGLEITLTDCQTSLSGSVTRNGEAIKDFVVVVFPTNLRDGVLPTRFTRTIRPDQQGRYQLRGLPPGDYVVVAVESLEQGGEWDPAFQQQLKGRGKVFRLSDAQLLSLDLDLAQ